MSKRERGFVRDCIVFYDARGWDWSIVVEFLVNGFSRGILDIPGTVEGK